MKTAYRLLILLCVSLFSYGCCKESTKPNLDISNTVLVYLAADNSLSWISASNLEQMMAGMAQCDPAANLLAYVDDKTAPRLYLIKKDAKGRVQKILLKEYEEHNSASKEVMHSVIEEAFERYPTKYKGLVLWSHGLNWFPVGFYGDNIPDQAIQGASAIKRSFGQDYVGGKSIEMSLSDLVEAIPDIGLDFIAFDACYMGSVEVAYALRNKAKQMIASPTEVLEEGFPYRDILPHMLTGTPRIEQMAETFYNYYNARSGYYRSATISVVNLSVMDRLADWTKWNHLLLNSSIDVYELQHFDRFYNRYQFDLRHLYCLGLTTLDASIRMVELDEILRELIVYKATTPSFMCNDNGTSASQGFQITHFCGLSSYYEDSSYSYLNQAYTQTDWYKATR